MLEQEIARERNLFFLLNGSDSVTMDHFMWLYSYKFTWMPLFVCLLVLFIYKYNKNWKECLLLFAFIIILILFCDRITSGFIKPFFESYRPTHHPDFKDQVHTVLGYRGGRYGFASSHASNIFGFALFTSLLIRKRFFTVLIFIHALVTIYTRVYLGVHFIADVVAGSLIGILIALPVYYLYLSARKFLILKNDKIAIFPVYINKEISYVAMIYFAIVSFILIFNNQLVEFLGPR